jgi:RND family efflux transporter MFP subunit
MDTLPDSLGAHASDLAFTITTDAGVVIPAQIDIVHPTVDPISKKVVVELRVNATDTMLPVGSSVTVVARVPHNDLLVVPASAVIARYGKNIVFTVTPDNIVHERDVQIGAHTELTVAITDGIHDGDRVVTDGYRYLRDGDTVTTE